MYFWRELVGLCDSAVASAELSGTGHEFTVVGRVVECNFTDRCQGSTPIPQRRWLSRSEAEALATFATLELNVGECVSRSAASLPTAALPSSV